MGVRLASRVRRAAFIVGAARGVILLVLLAGVQAAAQKLEKPVQDWLKQHRLLVTPDEQKVLQHLKAADVDAFVRIFWARRNPAPGSRDNPYRAAVEKARADADARFGDVGRRGSDTACGQVVMLLGNPDEVTGRELRNIFDTRPSADSRYRRPDPTSSNATRDGARRPELWTYKGSSKRTFRMPGGDLKLQFDDGCEFEESARTMDELARFAGERVVHPEIRYEFDAGGRLTPLADAPLADVPPPTSAATALLDRPRSDFSLVFEPKIQAPGEGGAYTAGILRGEAGALTAASATAPLRLRVAARATSSGVASAVDSEERDVFALVGPDGSFVTSFGLTLRPGRYRLTVATLEPISGRAGMATVEIDAPDYAANTLVVGPLAVLSGDAGGTGMPPPNDPMAAFAIGARRLGARPGNVLRQSESLQLLVLVHNATRDAATGRAAVKASFSVTKDGQLVAKGKEQEFDTAGSAPTVGPIALAPFPPGRYLARVEITDAVSKTMVARETPFEVVPAAR